MEGSREAPGEALGDADARRASQELQEPEPELREQLQRARAEYSMATGVISSLQRQLEIQESQLRRIQSEKEMLQRKLREREHQLQGLSAKFCSLTEEQEDKEMMVTIEKENCNLRQVVAEQESKLAEQRQLISELQEAVGQLQEEVRSSRHRLRQQRQARDAAQSQAEALQHQELQTRVALECLTSRVSVTPHCRVLPLPGDTPTISSTGCKSLEIPRAEAQREMHQGTAALCSRGPASRGQRCRKLGPFASQLFRMRLLRHSQSQQASNTGSP
ncbi:coiled-coil domain-containing protein 27 isoform X2 [Columba livia]|uniref:coiled-coil domain-containing protein 27 isoform X2 n=1 Tax=Columba livia TaxID=8932 RepID=UPI0031BB739C